MATESNDIVRYQRNVGTSLVYSRDVPDPAIRDAVAAIIPVHNHPSSDPTPNTSLTLSFSGSDLRKAE
ncbi:MAG: hypothetical protein ISR77_38395 [Pirellulaceae bacterium]|nr:hypothetical protein [Pirellulaceae bacterium]